MFTNISIYLSIYVPAYPSIFSTHEYIYILILALYDKERQVTKPTSPLQRCRLRTEFLPSRSRSIAVAPDTMCRAFF